MPQIDKCQAQIAPETLIELTKQEVARYKAWSPVTDIYFFADDDLHHYVVLDIPHYPRKFTSSIIVMARIVGDKIIIEVNNTDKPLVDALMHNAGIPREQIILAYAGEKVPKPATLR